MKPYPNLVKAGKEQVEHLKRPAGLDSSMTAP